MLGGSYHFEKDQIKMSLLAAISYRNLFLQRKYVYFYSHVLGL